VEGSSPARSNCRAWLPVPHISGFGRGKGGVGGIGAMFRIWSCAYGVLKAGSIWYPINLSPQFCLSRESLSTRSLRSSILHADAFGDCFVSKHGNRPRVHFCWVSLRRDAAHVPARPIVLGGSYAPPVVGLRTQFSDWLIHCSQPYDWFWFVALAVAFGIVAGPWSCSIEHSLPAIMVSFALRQKRKSKLPALFHQKSGEERR